MNKLESLKHFIPSICTTFPTVIQANKQTTTRRKNRVKNNWRNKRFILVYTSRIQSFMTDEAWWQQQKGNWFHCIHSEGAASGREVGAVYKAFSLPTNDTHPIARSHLIKVPRALQTALNLVFLRATHSKTWAFGYIFAFNP